MRILLFGKTGQLGWELNRTLAGLGTLTVLDYPEVDFAKPETLRPILREAAPDILINAIAYTDVDKAEKEHELARLVNAVAVGVIAEEALRLKALLIHYSTDYVFDGTKSTPYSEEDSPNPISRYGQSKLEGETALQQVGGDYLILRTGWMYSVRRSNFLLKVLAWARQQKTVRVAVDQFGNPTSARLLAQLTAQTLVYARSQAQGAQKFNGIYHTAGFGHTSRYDWARAILEHDQRKEEWVMQSLQETSANHFPTPAHRPPNCALDCSKFERTFHFGLPGWETGVQLTMDELNHPCRRLE